MDSGQLIGIEKISHQIIFALWSEKNFLATYKCMTTENTHMISIYHTWYSFLQTSEEGAQTTIYCAVQEGIEEHSGKYFADCRVAAPDPLSQDDVATKKLWRLSEELVNSVPRDWFKPSKTYCREYAILQHTELEQNRYQNCLVISVQYLDSSLGEPWPKLKGIYIFSWRILSYIIWEFSLKCVVKCLNMLQISIDSTDDGSATNSGRSIIYIILYFAYSSISS